MNALLTDLSGSYSPLIINVVSDRIRGEHNVVKEKKFDDIIAEQRTTGEWKVTCKDYLKIKYWTCTGKCQKGTVFIRKVEGKGPESGFVYPYGTGTYQLCCERPGSNKPTIRPRDENKRNPKKTYCVEDVWSCDYGYFGYNAEGVEVPPTNKTEDIL